MSLAAVAASSSGNNEIVAAVTGKRIKVKSFALYNGPATANTVKWRSASTDLTTAVTSGAAVGAPLGAMSCDPAPGAFLIQTVAGEALNLNLSAATAVYGWVEYVLD